MSAFHWYLQHGATKWLLNEYVYWTVSFSRKKTKELSLVNMTRPKPKDNDRKKPAGLPFKESTVTSTYSACLSTFLSFLNMSK